MGRVVALVPDYTCRARLTVKIRGADWHIGVGMFFHVIVITQRNSILKFYNNRQDHQTQTNK